MVAIRLVVGSYWAANCFPIFSSCKDEAAWLARSFSLFRLVDATSLDIFSDKAAMDSSMEGGSRFGGMVRVNESTN